MALKSVALLMMMLRVLHSIALAQAQATAGAASAEAFRPVVLVHGMIGSILEAQLDIPSDFPLPHSTCNRNTKGAYKRIWIDGVNMELPEGDCYFKYMEMKLVNGTVMNLTPGVNIRVPLTTEGSVYCMDTLDPGYVLKFVSHEYHEMIEALKKVGYQDQKSLFGISYDWRILPTLDANWVTYAKGIVEKAFSYNQKAVVMVGHSLGGPTARSFLSKMTEEWRKKYVKELVTVAAPWTGSAATIKAVASGFNFGLPIIESRMRDVGRTVPGGYCLFPNPRFYGAENVFATQNGKNYTAKNYQELFTDLGMDLLQSNSFLKDGLSIYDNFEFPTGIKMHCIFSQGINTIKTTHYNDKWHVISTEYESGDGIVSIQSSRRMCEQWAKNNTVEITEMSKLEHIPIIRDKNVIEIVKNIAAN